MSQATPTPADIPKAKFVCGLLPWQRDLLAAFDDVDEQGNPRTPGLARRAILEVHRRARKTTTALNMLIREACRNPKCAYLYIGPTYAHAQDIIWQSPEMLFDYLPDKERFGWESNASRLTIKFQNGSILQLFGSEDPDRVRGIKFRGAVIDEWSECYYTPENNVYAAISPIFRESPLNWIWFLYTPKGNNHATRMFDDAACISEGYSLPENGRAQKCRDGWYAVRLNNDYTNIISAAEVADEEREKPKAFVDQEYRCARITEEAFTLITSAMLEILDRDPPLDGHRAIIAIDPSMGGDECSLDVHRGTRVLERCSVRTRDPDMIVAKARVLSDTHRIYDFIVDAIGIGEAVANPLSKDERYQVIRFISSESSDDPKRFRNKRTDMWWAAMEEVRACKVQYPPDEETRRQIPYASRYKPDGRTVQILSKQEIRKLLGRSPDRADSWAMARYGLPRAREYLGEFMQFRPIMARQAGGYDKAEYDPKEYLMGVA